MNSDSEKVTYVSKDKLYPLFGKAYFWGEAEVREDLPKIVRDFVTEHELYHLRDSDYSSLLGREYRANAHAAKKHPIGFIATGIMSLTPARISHYINLVGEERRYQKNRKLVLEEIDEKNISFD